MRKISEYVLLPILVGICIFYLTALRDFSFQKKLVILFGTMVLSLIVVYILHIRRPKERFSKENNALAVPEPNVESEMVFSVGTADRKQLVPTKITPHYLVDLFRDYKSHEARKIIKPFMNKWMVVTGNVFDVGDEHVFLTHEGIRFYDRVFAYFDKEKFENVTALLKGKKITVIGELAADTFNIELCHCEVLQWPTQQKGPW